MNPISRRLWITGGVTLAGFSGLAVANKLARRYGLLPPDNTGKYGIGHSLTYASQRLIGANSLAREFPPSLISKNPFANGKQPKEVAAVQDWRLTIDGLVARPTTYSMSDLKAFQATSQITHLACEEGWSFIAEWTGVRLSKLLEESGIKPEARYVIYKSMERFWTDSIDMSDSLHPQTLVTYQMNGAPLPPGHGGPLRLRVPRQLGYKSVKYLTTLTVTDTLKDFQPSEYSWYAGM